MLQRCPHILRQVAVHAPVAHGPLKRGADLYAGGVVGFGHATRETAGSWPEALFGGPIAQGELVAVCARDSWAPVAVGRFSKSSEDMVLEGSRGACVDVLLRVGDGVWPNTAVDESTASSSPPEFCVAAAAAAAESAADALALAAERHAARTAAAAAAAHAAEVLDLKARTKRLAKSLRQVADLRGRELKDDAQRAKAARGPALEAELAYAEARLAELQRAVDDAAASNGVVETAVEGAAERDGRGRGAMALTPRPPARTPRPMPPPATRTADDDADEEEDAAPPPSPDEIFRAAFLTTLRRDLKPPVLAAEAVGAAAKLGGASVKETSWKKAAKFLESLAGVVDCREKSKGVLEVVSVDWGRAPPFELVEKAAVADEFAALRATKRGGCVTVSVRRVRNKNCTFVDGLDGWGFDEARQKAVAAALRTKFSAAASVAARKGTEDNRKGKKFFSIMVQGKYAGADRRRPPAGFWRAHGVGAGEEGPGDEEGPAGVLERALAGCCELSSAPRSPRCHFGEIAHRGSTCAAGAGLGRRADGGLARHVRTAGGPAALGRRADGGRRARGAPARRERGRRDISCAARAPGASSGRARDAAAQPRLLAERARAQHAHGEQHARTFFEARQRRATSPPGRRRTTCRRSSVG